MERIWGIHNDQSSLDLVTGGFVSVGWEELGDLSELSTNKEALKLRISESYPSIKPGAIPVWAGMISRFVNEIHENDLVVSPRKSDRTINLGRIVGSYFYEKDEPLHPSRRHVHWLKTNVPRDTFSKSARNEIGSAVTLFQIKRNADEFRAALGLIEVTHAAEPVIDDVELAEDEPNAERVDTYSRDFVVDVLRQMDPYKFEHLVAGVLRSMGYRANATVASGDGGVDIIASRDPLALEPPIIKVQCKRTVTTIGGPDVQKLVGTLAPGGLEVGLFVTLGAFSPDALHIERTRQDLRLLNGTQLVDLIFEHYDGLNAEWKRLLPLRRVHAVDRGDEAFGS